MFDHSGFRTYSFDEVPLHLELFLMDEKWMVDYEKAHLVFFDGGEFEQVGNVGYAAVRSIGNESMELSWFANTHDRFHEVTVTLPRDAFLICVECSDGSDKPVLFVKSSELMSLYLRSYSVFAIVDVIGVKDALKEGKLTRGNLLEIRTQIDEIAASHPDISFVSFADSLLLKSNWSVGTFDSDVNYTYDPEVFLKLTSEIRDVYIQTLGMDTYTILTQGSNEYYDDPLLHIASTKNHICLNSLGLPFSQLLSIDSSAREAIKNGVHEPAELYLDEGFYYSLRFRFEFEKHAHPSNEYPSPMSSGKRVYYYSDFGTIVNNLKSNVVA